MLILLVVVVCMCYSYPLSRSTTVYTREEPVERTSDNSTEDGGNSTQSDFVRQCSIMNSVCPEGIANMVALGVAGTFVWCLGCVLYIYEFRNERKTKTRLALERNRAIDRQIEEAKRRRLAETSEISEENRTTGSVVQEPIDTSETDKTLLLKDPVITVSSATNEN